MLCDVRQIEVHMDEELVHGPSCLEVEIAIAKSKKYKSPGSNQILAELTRAGGETLLSAINKLINSVLNKEDLADQWKEDTILPNHKNCVKSDCNNYRGISLLSTSYKMLSNILSRFHNVTGWLNAGIGELVGEVITTFQQYGPLVT
jgi:hypothetical protein